MASSSTNVRWTVADLELLPEDGRRYEIIDEELFVTPAPHWKHQNVAVKIGTALENWSVQSGLGEAAVNPGLVFKEAESWSLKLEYRGNLIGFEDGAK
jgi:Uma2 family endonuclease